MKENCWEFMGCGREPGGLKSASMGVCPASTGTGVHGLNGGLNGGRYCWRVAGTYCGAPVLGTWARRIMNCVLCDFFMKVQQEEGDSFVL